MVNGSTPSRLDLHRALAGLADRPKAAQGGFSAAGQAAADPCPDCRAVSPTTEPLNQEAFTGCDPRCRVWTPAALDSYSVTAPG